MKKILLSSLLTASAAFSSHAAFLLQDSLNYPYTNGCIEGQGQWYCYSPSTPALDAYVTNKALDGLFKMVAQEEKNIRQNPVARTTDLMKTVFGAVSGGK